MKKINFHNQGQSLIGIIIVLIVVSLLIGGLYYYLQKEIPEIPEITEKPAEKEIIPKEEIAIPPEEIIPKEEIKEKPIEEPIIQKCVDGTLYGQCSINKPKYCKAGQLINKAFKCGCPLGSEISGNYCIVELPSLDPRSGLIVIREGVDGESFAREIAFNRGWNILTVNTSDHNKIRKEISNFYNQNNFDYLLLIGTIEEISYAIYKDGKWKTAPMLYGNVNNDRFIELAVGVLPFSSEVALRRYFTDLNPRGDFITIENYTHHAIDLWREYTFGRCLVSASPSIRSHKLTSPLSLANHYQESAVIFLRNGGLKDSVFSASMDPNNPDNMIRILHICSFEKNFDGEFQTIPGYGVFCNKDEIEYLTNRPIIIHSACHTAKKLGKQLIKNGAGAFLGAYEKGGFNMFQIKSKFLSGKSIGEVIKHIYNSSVMTFTLIPGRIPVKDFKGLNTFNLNDGKELPHYVRYNYILFGDPTLEVPKFFQKLNPNTTIKQRHDRIVINVNPPKLFPLDADIPSEEFKYYMCYTGGAIFAPSVIGRENKFWFENHVLHLKFPVTEINRLKSHKVIIGNQEIILDNSKGEEYRINLLKGEARQYLFVSIRNPGHPRDLKKGKFNRLDYTKNIQIQIKYE